MKYLSFVIVFMIFFTSAFSQNYDIEKLKIIATIWGETYLFHPSVIRSDKNLEWEQILVNFLPKINRKITTDEFVMTVNSGLLSKLDDPFTILQDNNPSPDIVQNEMITTKLYDYLKITNNDFADISRLQYFNNLITDRSSDMPLVIDLRIDGALYFDYHKNSFIDYLAAMFIDTDIPDGSLVNREHFGWDEHNNWWFYEQRWKIHNIDKEGSSTLHPLPAYMQEIIQYVPDFDFDNFKPIKRPIYLITNNSFLSYFNTLISTLKTHRENLYVINENKGKIYIPENSEFIKYSFEEFNFILNPAFCVNKSIPASVGDLSTELIDTSKLNTFIKSKPVIREIPPFNFEIAPKIYNSPEEFLSKEEKILGIIKIWTIIKYFYAYPELCSIDWNNSLGTYLEAAQNTGSDKEYFTLVQEIMSNLNDSHTSTFHPSILDFSEIFTAPLFFDYIEDKVIITAVYDDIAPTVQVGDEILSIDGKTIDEIMREAKRTVSSSNRQGFISVVINPGYFLGVPESIMKLVIKKENGQIDVEIPRTMPIFQLMIMNSNFGTGKVFENNIGYLNMAAILSSEQLESELRLMQDTKALIIDMRCYPLWDYNSFLKMLANEATIARIDEVPIISANNKNCKQIQKTQSILYPDNSFIYNNPIVVLTYKKMISRSEDICINLKTLPNVTFIGEQTQGTDGETTRIFLPGGGITTFTGQTIKFGNGDNFQGTGIIPDIKVTSTINGIKEGKDEILEKAINFLQEK